MANVNHKRTRQLCTILAVFLLSITMSGCNAEGEYDIQLYRCDGGTNNEKCEPYDFKGIFTNRIFFPSETYEVEIGGQKISGRFSTEVEHGESCHYTYVYKTSEGSFSIASDGMVVGYRNSAINRYYTSPVLSEDEYIEKAKTFLTDMIDISDYNVSYHNVDNGIVDVGVKFVKYIDGIKSSDAAWVYLTYGGVVDGFDSDMLSRIPADTENPFDINQVTDQVHGFLDEFYSDKRQYFTYFAYEEPDITLTLLKNGEVALLYKVYAVSSAVEEPGEADYVKRYFEFLITE